MSKTPSEMTGPRCEVSRSEQPWTQQAYVVTLAARRAAGRGCSQFRRRPAACPCPSLSESRQGPTRGRRLPGLAVLMPSAHQVLPTLRVGRHTFPAIGTGPPWA